MKWMARPGLRTSLAILPGDHRECQGNAFFWSSPAPRSLGRWPGSVGIGGPSAGSLNRPMMRTLGVKSPRCRRRSRVLSRGSRSKTTVVKVGDLLVKIDDRDYRAQLAHAEASVAVQRATLANLDANRRLQEAMMEEASADIAAATAELARAKRDVDRYQDAQQRSVRLTSTVPTSRCRLRESAGRGS